MEASSLVSKARTAFHSAAAKAERVFTDIKKSDSSTNQGNRQIDSIDDDSIDDSDKQSPTISNSYSLNNAGESKGSEVVSSPECLSNLDIIPSASVMKQLAIAVEAGKKFKSMKEILASSRDSSPVRERAISAVKSLVLREKEEKLTAEFGGDEKVLSLLNSLLDAEGQCPGRSGVGSDVPTNMASFPKDIHGAPPQSFVIKLSEVIGSLKTLRKMALFWYKVVAELRRLWFEGQYVPGIPPDEIPDLNLCLFYQQLQVINCCISRKRRRLIATESLESVIRQASANVEERAVSEGTAPVTPLLYARISTGELVLRLGADKDFENLTMLETGEPVYTPIMQEGPLLTEDLIKETEGACATNRENDNVAPLPQVRLLSVGAGCSQLLSDMQAFKAANPGCTLEDFVRWHSPPDWMDTESDSKAEITSDDGDLLSTRGQLSSRMQKEGNLWRELWETAKPVPAVKQAPLLMRTWLCILNDLEDIPPAVLFEQLFVSLLGSGFVIADEKLSEESSLSKLFCECKEYIIATCQGRTWTEKVDDICQVYETVEMMLLKPEEVLKIIKQPEETTPTSETRSRFKRLGVIFGNKDRHLGKSASKDHKNYEDNPMRQSFSSIFSKKPPRPDAPSPDRYITGLSRGENKCRAVDGLERSVFLVQTLSRMSSGELEQGCVWLLDKFGVRKGGREWRVAM
ncbi:hypothetical protein Acr_29g0011520 [Actinidia rufa]|uniref:Rab3GAP catalytic subunit conserved domain-containing protein n=1 Tax=Actinidia rufa TaxID=165716 RepID=A0A7J0HFS5_9ERIC|nr:hypothetical protein Acr_29g0011520 [Actinidia rufa]